MSDKKLSPLRQKDIRTGAQQERERIITILEEYLELARFSVEVEGATENKEWDNGFQSALALVKIALITLIKRDKK
jgi:hypothetical protein